MIRFREMDKGDLTRAGDGQVDCMDRLPFSITPLPNLNHPRPLRRHISSSFDNISTGFFHLLSRQYINHLRCRHLHSNMCLPCFPWTWTKYEDPMDSMPDQSIWLHDGQSWALQKVVSATAKCSLLSSSFMVIVHALCVVPAHPVVACFISIFVTYICPPPPF